MRKSKWNELSRIFSAVQSDMTVYVPQNDGPVTRFAPWTEGCALSGVTLTEKNPKELFFPQSENLMAFRMAQKKIEILEFCGAGGSCENCGYASKGRHDRPAGRTPEKDGKGGGCP